MRKFTLLLSFAAMATLANATVYLDETFDYADEILKNNSGWNEGGTIGSWNSNFMILPTPLTYSADGKTYVLSGQGKRMSCNYTSGSTSYLVNKNFSETLVTSGTVYASFLYTPAGEKQSQSQSPAISLSASGSLTGAQVWVGKGSANTSDFRFATTRGSTNSADIKWTTEEFSDLNAVYFIVLKYDLDAETSYLYINPTPGITTEPTPNAFDNTGANPKTSIQNVQLKVNGASKQVHQIGNIRICSTWEEAVATQATSSVSDRINQETKKIYCTDKAIYLPGCGEATVYDLYGKALIRKQNTDIIKTKLPSGVYIVSFTGEDSNKTIEKIIIR